MSGAAVTGVATRSRWRDYMELSKSRIVFMIVLTTLAGFMLGAGSNVDVAALVHTLVGTAMVAAGTNALNQYFERKYDAKMNRTRLRPLPDGRISERAALIFSTTAAVAGIAYLGLVVHWLPALLAFVTLFTYLMIYTPLKRVSSICTIVGAFPGALPPVIGWAAARHELGTPALLVFALMFLWQLPHFLAIGWLYREDYARAGFVMLAVRDGDGRLSGRDAVLYAIALVVVSFLPFTFGVSGVFYAIGAMASGLLLLAVTIQFAVKRTDLSARKLFMASNLYLPVVMLLMVVNRTI